MGNFGQLGRIAACIAVVSAASAAIGQGAGPVSSSDVGVSGRYVPQAAPQEERDNSSRSTRGERRATRGLIKLGLGGIAGLGAIAGGVATKGAKSPKHRDGHKDGRARGRGVTQNSNVPPGSTRFR